jgi:hypothetical protein
MCLNFGSNIGYAQWGVHHTYLKILLHKNCSPKIIYVCFCEHFHNQNDIKVYHDINSLHEKLIPKLNIK